MQQGSPEWYQVRLGIPTASEFHRILTPGGQPSKQARPYMYRLIAERVLGESMDDRFTGTEWMHRGKREEPNAAAQFAFTNDMVLEEVGFVTTNDGRMGCSPDRLISGRNEIVEVKAPAPWTQVGYLLDGPGDQYKAQVQGQLLIGEYECVHFYAWHPRMPPVHIVTLRDEPYLKLLDRHLQEFVDQLDEEEERCRRLGPFAMANIASQAAAEEVWGND